MVSSSKIFVGVAVIAATASAGTVRGLAATAPVPIPAPTQCSPSDWISWNPFAKKGANICSGLDHCCPTVKGDRSKGAKGTCVSMATSCSSVGTADPAAVQAKAASCNAGDWFSWSPVKAGDGICVGAQHCCPNKKGDRSAGAAGSCVSWSTSCSEVGTTDTTPAATSDDKATIKRRRLTTPAAAATAAVDNVKAQATDKLAAVQSAADKLAPEQKAKAEAFISQMKAKMQDPTTQAQAAEVAGEVKRFVDANKEKIIAALNQIADEVNAGTASAQSVMAEVKSVIGTDAQNVLSGHEDQMSQVKQFMDAHKADARAFLKAHEAQLQAAVVEHKGDIVAAIKKVAAMVQDGSLGAQAAASASA